MINPNEIAGLPRVLQEWDENPDREYSCAANHLIMAINGSLNLPDNALENIADVINRIGGNVAGVLDTEKMSHEDIRTRELFQKIERGESMTSSELDELDELLEG